MNTESKNCSNNCYAIIALCVSFLALGLLLGNWMGQCTKTKNYKTCNINKCKSYKTDGNTGSTCSWSKTSENVKKSCNTDCTKSCCANK